MIDVKELKRALVSGGLEVFRTRGDEVHLAERQNVQLMEAGVRVRGGEAPLVTVVSRAQRNDAPAVSAEAFFELVRARSSVLREAGYAESTASAREIRSVSDPTQLLDVWYEVTWTRPVATTAEAVAEARRAIAAERYIVP
ncbi:MAG: hypothetical protein U0324_21980 [Polyangiales bacterium]